MQLREKASRLTTSRLHWMIALIAAAALLLPVELVKFHAEARTLGGRVIGALIAWLFLAAVLRAIIYAVSRAWRGDARWPAPTARAQGWTVRYALAALVAGSGLVIALSLVLSSLGTHVTPGVGALITEAIFLATLLPLYRSGRLRPVDLGLRRVPGARSVGLAVFGLVAYALFSGVWIAAVHPPAAHSNFVGIEHKAAAVILLTGFAAAVGAPVAEEVFFRGFLYRSLRNRMSILPACLIVGVIFGLGHTQYPLLVRPELAGFGVVTCLIYERCGSLLPGIALHSFIDARGFEVALTGRSWIVWSFFILLAAGLLARRSVHALRRSLTGPRVPAQ